jgi:hypothetical protein
VLVTNRPRTERGRGVGCHGLVFVVLKSKCEQTSSRYQLALWEFTLLVAQYYQNRPEMAQPYRNRRRARGEIMALMLAGSLGMGFSTEDTTRHRGHAR